jgi:2-amino-4-hydroxy-6-hydroxymethyldihydropteridine diphosphokinase/dihydropteroate synthase
MTIYLGLGSNLGDRRAHLAAAIDALAQNGVTVVRVSPVVESPALLPPEARPDWNLPFLNLAVECRAASSQDELLNIIKTIEASLGRRNSARWSPRPIDIDILLWDDVRVSSGTLTIPHPALTTRNFVLAPLLALHPNLVVPDGTGKTVLQRVRELTNHIPLWMGIVNLTPDSFSDGGEHLAWEAIEAHIDAMWNAGAQIIDFGAESTRPGAVAVSADEELARLMPVLELVTAKYAGHRLRPLISVDTYHPQTAEHALALGADIINDVSGLTSPAMLELAATHTADWVAMHHVTIPVDPQRTLPQDADVCAEVERWLERQVESWTRLGLPLDRILFDPGIGFGKNPLQSLALLRDIRRFQRYGLRCLVGHSRKSFMQSFATRDNLDRDLTTIGASLYLCAQGVDVLRVHNVPAHVAAYRGWAHVS